eukprot:scaffold23350_cov63-Phaeocystis_antarctica.AAC.1
MVRVRIGLGLGLGLGFGLANLPLGAENAVRPVVVGQREGLGGRREQAGLVQDPARGKEDLVFLVAVGHDEVHLAVVVQVGHDDLGRRRGGIKGGAANRGCRGEVARVHARLEVDHVRGPEVAHDDFEVAVAVDVGHLHRLRGRLVVHGGERGVCLGDRVILGGRVLAEDRAWVRRLLSAVELERAEVQHVLAPVVNRDDVGRAVVVDVGHQDVGRNRRGRARIFWRLDLDGRDGREVVAPRVEVGLGRPIHEGGDEIVEAVVVDVGHLERRHQLDLGKVEARGARREHVARRRRRLVLVLDAAGENEQSVAGVPGGEPGGANLPTTRLLSLSRDLSSG